MQDQIIIEHTDTFAGEANYCWVNRKVIESDLEQEWPSRLSLVRKAKAFAGRTGERSYTTDYGDLIEIRFKRDICEVIFIYFQY